MNTDSATVDTPATEAAPPPAEPATQNPPAAEAPPATPQADRTH